MKIAVWLLMFLIGHASYGQNLRLELFGGSAHSFPSEVTVRQKGYPEVSKVAQWSTRPLEPAPYYSARIGWWSESSAWEVEMLHHKIYMDNTDNIFVNYRSTFGFNMFLLNRAYELTPYLIVRYGIGPVVSHPINNIRGKEYSSNVVYHIVGASAQGAIQSRQKIINNLYVTQEAKITYAFANLPISDGDSSVTNLAIHGLIGLSYDF